MEFAPITTQEEFNEAIKDRLASERRVTAEKYADYDELKGKISAYEEQISTFQQTEQQRADETAELQRQIDELTAKNKRYETDSVKTKVALELGLPAAMASRLTGEDEASIRQDAESLASLFAKAKGAPPLRNCEGDPVDPKEAALRQLTQNLTKGE